MEVEVALCAALPVAAALGVAVPEAETLWVTLGQAETLGEPEAVTRATVKVTRALDVEVTEKDCVFEPVALPPPPAPAGVEEDVLLPVLVELMLCTATVGDTETVPVAGEVALGVEERLALRVGERVAVAVRVGVAGGEKEVEGEAAARPVGVMRGVRVLLPVPPAPPTAVPVTVTVAEAVGVGGTEAVPAGAPAVALTGEALGVCV